MDNINEQITQAQAERKENLETLKDIKSVLSDMKEGLNANNEEMKSFLDKMNAQKVIETNGETVSAKSQKKDTAEAFEAEIKDVCGKMMANTADVKERAMFESDTFRDYVQEKALEQTCGNKAIANRIVEETMQEYKEVVAGSQKGVVLPMLEKKDGTFRESVGADGGFVANPAKINPLKELWNQPHITMTQLANHQQVNGSTLTVPLEFEGVKVFWEGEENHIAEDSKPTYGKIDIKVGTLIAQGKMTRTIKEDSSIDLYNRFLLHIRNESEKAKNTAFYLGTGENDRPKGLFSANYGLIDNDAPFEANKFRKYVYEATSTTQSFDTDIQNILNTIQATIYDVQSDIDGLGLFMHPELYTAIMQKLASGDGRYFVDTTMPKEMSPVKKLFGVPVITDKNIPNVISGKNANRTVVANGKGIFLGNMNQVYTIADRLSLFTWMDVITDTVYYKYYTRERIGGGATGFNKGVFIVEE